MAQRKQKQTRRKLTTQSEDKAVCSVSDDGAEIRIDLVVPDAVFFATLKKPVSCSVSTKAGATRRAVLLFD